MARAFASVTVDASQFALTIAAPGSGVGILIYPRRRPELLVWMAPGVSLFRNCEGNFATLAAIRHASSFSFRKFPFNVQRSLCDARIDMRLRC